METAIDPDLAARIAEASWYHTLDLGGGVVTRGEYDLRPALNKVPLPDRLDGMRCLDVGTRDGFWAFEMERRGASEVVGIDIFDSARLDWPQPPPVLAPEVVGELGRRQVCFEIAKEALGSRAERVDLSVYDLTPEAIGRFDFAIIGTLLLHLRDPVGALTSIARVLDGRLLVNDVVSLSLSLVRPWSAAFSMLDRDGPFWTIPNVRGFDRRLIAAGYEIQQRSRPYLLSNGVRKRPSLSSLRAPGPTRTNIMMLAGMPHVWALARPRAGII